MDVLTEPVNNDPVIEAHGSLPLIRRATALGNNDCFAGLSTTLVDATYGNGDGVPMLHQLVMLICRLIPISNAYSIGNTNSLWYGRMGWCAMAMVG